MLAQFSVKEMSRCHRSPLCLCASSNIDSSLWADKERFLATRRAHDVQATLATSSRWLKLAERLEDGDCDKTVPMLERKLRVPFTRLQRVHCRFLERAPL